MIDLVIFDCDGVLVDSELISADVLIAELGRHGVAIDRDYVRAHFLGRSFPKVAQTIREQHAMDLPEDFELRYRAALLARFETELRPTPGVENLLADLKIAKCVATSSSPTRVGRSLQIVGLQGVFGDHVFTASQVARGKPEPDLFLFACKEMGCVPERTLVVEDSVPGVTAARSAGMAVAVYLGGAHMKGRVLDIAMPTPSFDNWSDFHHLLKSFDISADMP